MSIAIKVENLSKAYQLGEIGTGTISRDLERYWATLRGKEDPFLKIGEANDRTKKGTSDIVWSLKDLNFEIEQGDAVGIIGRNGAGKSTLLKILSRVTSPTTGNVKIKGRVASLLEVGTGFHPELTGRENIYLNGAILGMRKAEIKKHFDAIVDFAGVERYVDTPVKRYSSGMYVRLAFAVAAHLESEILVVDEVLAVGDAEFQKKCLGKMNEVSKGEGRTILFVSHNMGSIETLCTNAILLKNGLLYNSGLAQKIISEYNNLSFTNIPQIIPDSLKKIYLSSIDLIDEHQTKKNIFSTDESLIFNVTITKNEYVPQTNFLFFLKNSYGGRVFIIEKSIQDIFENNHNYEKRTVIVTLPREHLMPGNYSIEVGVLSSISEYLDHHNSIVPFEIIYGKTNLAKYGNRDLGVIFPNYKIQIQ